MDWWKSKESSNVQSSQSHEEPLEINDIPSLSGSETNINRSCLLALRDSYLSLESLHLLNMSVNYNDPEEHKSNTNFALFQRLKVMTVDATMILVLSKFLEFKLPHGLKILSIPYYSPRRIQEDLELARALKVRSFPCLETVIVPSKPIGRDGTQRASEGFKERWLQERRELEKAEVFTSGKVKLRIVEPGESSEYRVQEISRYFGLSRQSFFSTAAHLSTLLC